MDHLFQFNYKWVTDSVERQYVEKIERERTHVSVFCIQDFWGKLNGVTHHWCINAVILMPARTRTRTHPQLIAVLHSYSSAIDIHMRCKWLVLIRPQFHGPAKLIMHFLDIYYTHRQYVCISICIRIPCQWMEIEVRVCILHIHVFRIFHCLCQAILLAILSIGVVFSPLRFLRSHHKCIQQKPLFFSVRAV